MTTHVAFRDRCEMHAAAKPAAQSKRRLATALAVFVLYLILPPPALAEAAPAVLAKTVAARAMVSIDSQGQTLKDVKTGQLLIKTGTAGKYLPAPTLDTDVFMKVTGPIARVRVMQSFHNPSDQWIEGVYVFPLPENAAVDHLKMRIGERIIEGRIKERGEAKKAYEIAKIEGKKAALIEEQRPNLFTNSIANIGPNEFITIEIEYQQTIRYDQGEFRLRFPLAITPRYVPGSKSPLPQPLKVAVLEGNGNEAAIDADSGAMRISPPFLIDGHAHNLFSLWIEVDHGAALANITSSYHGADITRGNGTVYNVRLKEDQMAADRDFELVWSPATGTPQASAFREIVNGKEYMLVMLTPPAAVESASARLPRETILIVDTSGSMGGTSIEQAKAALQMALDRLGPQDRFNIIEFNSFARALFPDALPVSENTIAAARRFVGGLKANGGTEMLSALKLALNGESTSGLIRQVIFMTDGAVGNEDELFAFINQRLGDSRLFTVGIGAAPNNHFMTKAAEFGRGTFTHIGDVREVQEKMTGLFRKLESPVLKDVTIAWPKNVVAETFPALVPDLYAGEPMVIAVALDRPVAVVAVSGKRGKETWTANAVLADSRDQSGVGALWARAKIAQLMDDMRSGADADKTRNAIIQVALDHHLVSKYTSLVAVDVTPARPADTTLTKTQVALNLPHGAQAATIFGQLPQTATTATQDAAIGLAALLLVLLLLGGARRLESRAANLSSGLELRP